MANLQKDIQNILCRINTEITVIDYESDKVGEIVEADLDSLYNEYRQKSDQSISIDQFKEKYRDYLSKKKLESLNVAKEKLRKLRDDITFSMVT